jgi:hypothetical protein
MIVALSKSDGSTEYVSADNFSQKNLTTYKKQGDVLNVDDDKITIAYNGDPMSFTMEQPISVEYMVWSSADYTYGDSNRDSRENLVVITHGLNGKADNDWLVKMRNNILGSSNSNTTVKLYDWQQGARSAYQGVLLVDNVEAFSDVYANAAAQGKYLAKHIADYKTPPKNIHLIAHSVGSNLIEETVKELADACQNGPWKEYYQQHPDVPKPFIHLTFLDAFAPWDSTEINRYGNLFSFDGYAEQYIDNVVNNVSDFAYTNMQLKSAVNFDVTYLKDASGRTHNWPNDFYNDSFDPLYKAPGDNSADGNYFRFGFRFAKESKEHIDPQYHNNEWCIITNVSEPYRRCFDHSVTEDRDVIITDPNNLTTILGGGLVDVSQFIGFKDDIAKGTLPPITISNGAAQVEIPSHVTVTSSISGWDGIFSTPIVKNVSNLEINTIDGKPNYNNFSDFQKIAAINVGVEGGKLSFSEAVEITLHGSALTSDVIYSHDGHSYFTISDCKDNQKTGENLNGGECKMRNDQNEFVIWTQHFTTFVTYTQQTDIIAPTTSVLLTGTQSEGLSDTFRSSVQVTLTASDNDGGSGVAKTEYSFDGGDTWTEYTGPFMVDDESIQTMLYRSIDNAGNTEEENTQTIVIDKTAPVLSGVGANASGETGANFRFASDDAGAYFFLVYPAADAAPGVADILAQGTAVAKGSDDVLVDDAVIVPISGLGPGVVYTAYLVVRDSAGNVSDIAEADFATDPASSEEITITGITIKTSPTKTAYTEGDALDLSGLIVTLTKSDDSIQDVALINFAINSITTNPENGATLSVSNMEVTIVAGEHEASQEITLSAVSSDDENGGDDNENADEEIDDTDESDESSSGNSSNEDVSRAEINSWEASIRTSKSKCSKKLELDITGHNFTSDTKVLIGGKEASSVEWSSSKKMTAIFCLESLLKSKTDYRRAVSVQNSGTDRDKSEKKIDLKEYASKSQKNTILSEVSVTGQNARPYVPSGSVEATAQNVSGPEDSSSARNSNNPEVLGESTAIEEDIYSPDQQTPSFQSQHEQQVETSSHFTWWNPLTWFW